MVAAASGGNRLPLAGALSGESIASRATPGMSSPPMQLVLGLLRHAAEHAVPVLLVGEGGTGKTTFGRAIHVLSARAAGPFVRVDGPAAKGDLSIESAEAQGGTLFLDEVAELSPPLQTAALRLLQGGRPPPFRVVASTRHDLDAELAAGRFRKDLFYRLDVLRIRVPPLRERREDILPIARAFLASAAEGERRAPPEISPALEQALLRYAWPGNVQELLAVLQRMLILSPEGSLDLAALPDRMSG
jgi:DNA-binding NtrC family response regulator